MLTDADRRWLWNTLDSSFRHWVTRLERFIFVATQAEIDAITAEIRDLDIKVDAIDDWIDEREQDGDVDNEEINLDGLRSAVDALRNGIGTAVSKTESVTTAPQGGTPVISGDPNVTDVPADAPHVVNPAVEDPSLPTPAPAGVGPVAESAAQVVPDPATPGADDRGITADGTTGSTDAPSDGLGQSVENQPVNNVSSDPTIVN